MNRKWYLFLLIAIAIGIQPVCAQQGRTTTIDLELASDDTFSEALDESSDVEMVKKNDLAAKAEKRNNAAEAIAEAQKKIQESAETAQKAETIQKGEKK